MACIFARSSSLRVVLSVMCLIFNFVLFRPLSVGRIYIPTGCPSEGRLFREMRSGSRGALRLPSPLRTARDHFSVMQLKPFVRPLRDAVSPLLTVCYGLSCDSWGEAKPDCRLYLSLHSLPTQDGLCAIL